MTLVLGSGWRNGPSSESLDCSRIAILIEMLYVVFVQSVLSGRLGTTLCCLAVWWPRCTASGIGASVYQLGPSAEAKDQMGCEHQPPLRGEWSGLGPKSRVEGELSLPCHCPRLGGIEAPVSSAVNLLSSPYVSCPWVPDLDSARALSLTGRGEEPGRERPAGILQQGSNPWEHPGQAIGISLRGRRIWSSSEAFRGK